MRVDAKTVILPLKPPVPTEAERTTLARLKEMREQGAKPQGEIERNAREAKARRRAAVAAELQNLMEVARKTAGLLDPKAAAAHSARIAKQIAAVAKQLAGLSERGQAGAVPLSAPQIADKAPADSGEAARESGAEVRQAEADAQALAARAENEARQVADRKQPQEAEDEARRGGDGAAATARPDMLRTKSVRDLLREAADVIRHLKSTVGRAEEQERAQDGQASRRYRMLQDVMEKYAAGVDKAALSVDPGLRVPSGAGGGVDIKV